jgi:hypothetical protein
MAGITKQTVFMLIIYIVLLIIMFSFVGISIQSGEADGMTKKLAWVLYGCSLVSAIVCVVSLRKFDGKFKHKRNMFIAALSLFATITAALVISKPTENINFKAITYADIVIVLIVNLIATFYLIDSTMKVAPSVIVNNKLVNKISQIANRPGISPTQPSSQPIVSLQQQAPSQISQVQPTDSFQLPEYSPQPSAPPKQ